MPTKCRDSDPLLGGAGTISRGVLYQGGLLYASRYGTATNNRYLLFKAALEISKELGASHPETTPVCCDKYTLNMPNTL
jgi:hypothetical protein